MNAYKVIEARVLNLKLRKLITKLETEVTHIDPLLLEIEQLRAQNQKTESEIIQIEAQWIQAIQKNEALEASLMNELKKEIFENFINTKEKP